MWCAMPMSILGVGFVIHAIEKMMVDDKHDMGGIRSDDIDDLDELKHQMKRYRKARDAKSLTEEMLEKWYADFESIAETKYEHIAVVMRKINPGEILEAMKQKLTIEEYMVVYWRVFNGRTNEWIVNTAKNDPKNNIKTINEVQQLFESGMDIIEEIYEIRVEKSKGGQDEHSPKTMGI